MLTLFYGNTGTGKSYTLMDKIKQDASQGRPVCVIVPDQFTFEYERMLYNHMGCALFNNGTTEVLSFSRLTSDIFRKTHVPEGSPADTTVKTAVMYRVIREIAEKEGFQFFAKQAKLPSFVNTALTMISELSHSGVTPEVLASLTQTAPEVMKPKLTDIMLIFSAYRNELERLGMRDTLEDTARAAEYAADSGYFSGMCLYMDEFKSFTGDQYEMIKSMLSDCAELTICMTADCKGKSGSSPFSAVNDTCARLASIAAELKKELRKTHFFHNRRFEKEELFSLSEALTALPPKACEKDASAVSIVSASDIHSECSFICAEIRRLVTEQGLHFRDIVILSRQMNDDIATLAPYLDKYDIPFYCDRKPSAHHKPLMLMINAVLELISAKKISTETLLRYAKTGLTDVTPEQIQDLENFCYKWDIEGEVWNEIFPDENCENTKKQLLEPVMKLKAACTDSTGEEICDAVRDLIAEIMAEEKLLERKSRYISEAESLEQLRENKRLCEQLDNILDSMEKALPHKISISRFREIFMLSAAQITLSAPPDTLDSVAAQQSDLARLTNPKVVFVMHANEGVFPFVIGESSTFPEREREFFRSKDHELSGSMLKRMEEERFNAFKAVTAASQLLYISYHLSDHAGKTLYRSSYIDRILRCVPNAKQINADELGLLFYCRTEKAAYSACTEKYDTSDQDFFTVRSELEKNPVYRDRFEYIKSIDMGSSHTIKDKSLMKKMYGKTLELSVSRFEDFERCPFMYFCKTGLKLSAPEKVEFNAIHRGNIMHLCLQTILENHPHDKFTALTADELRSQVDEITDRYISEKMGNRFGQKESFDFYISIMKDTLLMVLIHIQEELQVSSFIPSDFEHPVGVRLRDAEGSENKPVIMTAADGSTLNFTGTVDRVDTYIAPDGRKFVRVIDYKSGKKDYMRGQTEVGINLQMFLYLFALTDEKSGKYAGYEPAGALYLPVVYPKHTTVRNATDETRADCITSAMHMKGEVVDDMEVITAMDKGITGKYVPVKMKKDGGYYSGKQPISNKELEQIRKIYTELMTDMCSELYNGNVPASPLENKMLKCLRACSFCDYRTICRNYPDPVTRANAVTHKNDKKEEG